MVSNAIEYVDREFGEEGAQALRWFISQRRLAGPSLVKALNARFIARAETKNAISDLREQAKNTTDPWQRKALEERIIALQGSLFS